MYYVYTLLCEDNNFYIDYTADLDNRVESHKQGRVKSTRNRLPLELAYYEGYQNKQDAKQREKFLKSGSGHQYLEKRLSNYLNNNRDD